MPPNCNRLIEKRKKKQQHAVIGVSIWTSLAAIRKLFLHLLLAVLAGDWNVAIRAGGRARSGDREHAVDRQTGGDVGARHTRRKPVLPQKLSGHKAVVVLSAESRVC